MIVYVTSWCPFCQRLLAALEKTDMEYDVVDVEEAGNEEAAAWVESVNDGNRVVPTVRFADGSHATNPPIKGVERRYRALM